MIALKLILFIVEPGKTFTHTHPKAALTVAQQAYHFIDHKGCTVFGVGEITGEAVAVKLVQAIFGSHPQESIFVLRHTFNERTRHLLTSIEMSDIRM